MEFFSKVRERLHDELRADLEQNIRNAGLCIDDNEQWIMGQSPISDIFRGYYVTKVPFPLIKLNFKRSCTICNSSRDAPLEETWQLPVAVPASFHPYALAELIAHYGGVEKDVNVQCKTCGINTPHDSRPSYLQTPRILVIQALRFVVPKSPVDILKDHDSPSTDSDTSKRKRNLKRKVVKNPAHITFPLVGLDMTSYLRSPQIDINESYDLFAVVEHVGRRMDGGHYIAYIRAQDTLGKDQWWKCNDAKCWIVSDDVVSSAQGYIWFYERQTQRGVVPTDWGDVVSYEKGIRDGIRDDGGLATPESVERPSVETRRMQSDIGAARTRMADDVPWAGRLRGVSMDEVGCLTEM
jgi:ubiquitin carboxyl-terminal hydrolase 16/45